MTVTLTYDPTLARVRVTADALAAADIATVERSTDQIRWTTVRGASAWAVSGGAFTLTLDDYEFRPGVQNWYRVRGIETGNIGLVSTGATSSGTNGSRFPGLPAGLVKGDKVLIFASTRNAATGSVNTPAGWTQLAAVANIALLGREYDPAVWTAMPTVTFTNDTASEDTIAQSAAFRRMKLTPRSFLAQQNASAQDIGYPAAPVLPDGGYAIIASWKSDDWTSVAGIPGAFPGELGEATSTTGNDAGQVWSAKRQDVGAGDTTVPAGSLVVTGGAAAISKSLTVVFDHAEYLNEQTATITPTQTGIWLKSLTRPWLNMPVKAGRVGDPRRVSRTGVFDIAGSPDPVAVSDLRASKAWDMVVRTRTQQETEQLEYLLSAGEVLLLHVPDGAELPGGYITVGETVEGRLRAGLWDRRWLLPCRRAAPPGPNVYGSTSTCATIVADFATCADVVAAFATCADLLDYVASPEDILVP